MIDDLVTKDIVEPYRLFTSRAEYRLSLRQDNADRRLSRIGYQFGLLPRPALDAVEALEADIAAAKAALQQISLGPGRSAWEMMSHPDFVYEQQADLPRFSPRVQEQLNIEARYQGYIAHQERQAQALRKLDHWRIPENFSYTLPGLSLEARSKLEKRRPLTLGQASRIDGVTPAEIAVLQVRLKGAQTNMAQETQEGT